MQVFYVVDKSSNKAWKGGVGYVTPQMVQEHLPPPSPDNLILVRPTRRAARQASS